MCRNIKTLHHFAPPATAEEIEASALQYVRKLSGMRRPSRTNQKVFDRAVRDVIAATHRLLDGLEKTGAPRNREDEKRKAAERGRKREAALRARIATSP